MGLTTSLLPEPPNVSPHVAEAMAQAEMPLGDTVPTGTYLDMVANLPVIDPARIMAPVMVMRGEYDGIATDADLLDFFEKLPNQDRQFIVIAAGGHAPLGTEPGDAIIAFALPE